MVRGLIAATVSALIGGFIGYGAGVMLRQTVVGGLRVVQSQLIDSTFSVMGALCKADSVVTRDEIDAVKRTPLLVEAVAAERSSGAISRTSADIRTGSTTNRPRPE